MNKLIKDRGIINYRISLESNKSNTKVNYDIVNAALKVDGLSSDESVSQPEANEEFIRLLKQISVDSSKLPTKSINAPKLPEKTEKKYEAKSEESHNVQNFTKLYHPIKIDKDEDKPLKDRLSKLTSLCQKMPFERSLKEIDKIHAILRTFTTLSSQVDDDLLKLLSNIILYEYVDHSDLTLFGNKGFYLLLSGQVRPMTFPFLRHIGEPSDRFIHHKENDKDYPPLNPGECFGTLDEMTTEDVDTSKVLISQVVDSCEVLLITTSYYRRIYEKYESQKHADKLVLLKSQETFSIWPHQALVRIANILSWVTIPANTLICKEDEISSVLGFIKSGSCFVLRKLDVNKSLPGGKVVPQTTHVIIGSLCKGQSYGEVSLLDMVPMKHSLLTKDPLTVIQTDREKIALLDSDVRQLLRQSCQGCFDDVSRATVENIYMEQKLKKDWIHLKENVIANVIESRGIRPGEGKWNIMANPKNIY